MAICRPLFLCTGFDMCRLAAAVVCVARAAASAIVVGAAASTAADQKQNDDENPAAATAKTTTIISTHNIKSSFDFLHPILCVNRKVCDSFLFGSEKIGRY